MSLYAPVSITWILGTSWGGETVPSSETVYIPSALYSGTVLNLTLNNLTDGHTYKLYMMDNSRTDLSDAITIGNYDVTSFTASGTSELLDLSGGLLASTQVSAGTFFQFALHNETMNVVFYSGDPDETPIAIGDAQPATFHYKIALDTGDDYLLGIGYYKLNVDISDGFGITDITDASYITYHGGNLIEDTSGVKYYNGDIDLVVTASFGTASYRTPNTYGGGQDSFVYTYTQSGIPFTGTMIDLSEAGEIYTGYDNYSYKIIYEQPDSYTLTDTSTVLVFMSGVNVNIDFSFNAFTQGTISVSVDGSSCTINSTYDMSDLNDLVTIDDDFLDIRMVYKGSVGLKLGPSESVVPCFTDTCYLLALINDEEKYVNVKKLKEGDLLVNNDKSNKSTTRIKRIIKRLVDTNKDCPYKIPRDYFGIDVPNKDIYLSGDHAIKYNNKWYHPRCINLKQSWYTKQVLYYHIETENYFNDVLIVNNLETESYINYDDIKDKYEWKHHKSGCSLLNKSTIQP